MHERALLVTYLLVVLLGCAGRTSPIPRVAHYDLLITGGTVVDGSGGPAFEADVAVQGDRIVRVARARLVPTPATRVIDATGKVVAPGFVDLHAHIERLLQIPAAEHYLRQGVTTLVGNPDGGWLPHRPSPWPLGPYLDSVAAARLGPNVAYYVGHNTVRREVLGLADRAPSSDELARMRSLVANAMGAGAVGLSTGLAYAPGAYATTDEVVALARIAADSGGIYTSHIRSESDSLLESVAEAIHVGRNAHIPLVIDHHKAFGKKAWGASVRTLALVDSARAAGVDVMMNQYPYTAASTTVGSMVPAWAFAGGDTAFARRLATPPLRDSLLRGTAAYLMGHAGGDLRLVQMARVDRMPELQGKPLFDWAIERGLMPTAETGAELILEALRHGGATAIYHLMDEDDVRRIMRHPQTMIASDGQLIVPGEGQPHPRSYGTYPRVLGRYVREAHVLTLQLAIHKMTGMPADRLGLRDRGRIAEGSHADIVVFDPATITDRATYQAPHQYPEGVEYVVVNGAVTVEAGRMTEARAGRLLRHHVSPCVGLSDDGGLKGGRK
jgi:dihydroorotase/N-acyl-D-amino-acid deacylase